MGADLPGQQPFARQGMRQLEHFDGIEWLFENEEVVRAAKVRHHIGPGIVRIGRANNHLQFRKLLPHATDGFHTIPAGRHSNVHEGERIGLAVPRRLFDHPQTFLALIS